MTDTSETKKEYDLKYQKQNIRQIKLNINKRTEPDLIEWIEKQDNVQGYLKQLIKNDMIRKGAKQ